MTGRSLPGFREAKLLDLWRNQWRSADELRAGQDRKLRDLVRHAYETVPFYRDLYDSVGFSPAAFRGLADLQSLPIVSKDDLRRWPADQTVARGTDLRRCQASSSSGTTGIPLTVYASPRDSTVRNLGWIRTYLANGMSPFDALAAFVGRAPAERAGRWNERIGVFRRHEISAWLGPDEWVARLQKWRPEAMTGYVMTLRILAEFVRDRPEVNIRPRVIFHTSALLDDGSRRLFEDVFGCRVVDIYGSDEAGCIAWECPTCREYHVNEDLVLLEVLRDGRPALPGEDGDVVCTSLCSSVMPFIRYRQGDVVQVSARRPACGRGFPLIARIQGRVEDFLVLGNGQKMPPHPFYHCIDPVAGITRWRIVQETAGRLRVEILRGHGLSAGVVPSVERNLAALTRGEMQIQVVVVDDLAVAPGEKFRTIRSFAPASTPARNGG